MPRRIQPATPYPYTRYCPSDEDVHALRYHWFPKHGRGWIARDHWLVSLVESGCLILSHGDEVVACDPGTLVVLPAGLAHRAQSRSPDGVHEVSLVFPANFIADFKSFLGDDRDLRFPWDAEANPWIRHRLAVDTIAGFGALVSRLIVTTPSRHDACAALCQILSCMDDDIDSPYRDLPPWLQQALIRLRTPRELRSGPRRLAELCGKSLDHVNRTVKKYRQQTASQLVNELRIELVCSRLRLGDEAIADLAADVGFNDQSHFHRVFKALRGCTPLAWRKASRRG